MAATRQAGPRVEAASDEIPAEPLTPDGIRATARAAAREAAARAAQLEAAARGGDTTVSPEDLAAARQQAEWTAIQVEAAEHHADARAEQLRHEAWERLEATDIPEGMREHDDEVQALLEQARPLIAKAIALNAQQNGALWRAAEYGADDRNYSPIGADFRGYAPKQLPGVAYFDYHGRRYEYRPASTLLQRLLTPLKRDAITHSGGVAAAWLDGIDQIVPVASPQIIRRPSA